MNNKPCYFFDLDGTLTDPMVGITTCVQYALAAYGINEPDIRNLTKFIGPPLVTSFMEFYGVDQETAQGMLVKYRERFSTIGMYENEIYPGIKEMLEKLYNQGYTIAMATSKPILFAEKILEYFDIKKFFHVLAGASMDETRNTKDAVLKYALTKLQAMDRVPARIVMIGDRKFDVLAGKELGTETVGVLYGYGSEEEIVAAKPTHIVKTVENLSELLLCY